MYLAYGLRRLWETQLNLFSDSSSTLFKKFRRILFEKHIFNANEAFMRNSTSWEMRSFSLYRWRHRWVWHLKVVNHFLEGVVACFPKVDLHCKKKQGKIWIINFVSFFLLDKLNKLIWKHFWTVFGTSVLKRSLGEYSDIMAALDILLVIGLTLTDLTYQI